jgi:hypothetical protein
MRFSAHDCSGSLHRGRLNEAVSEVAKRRQIIARGDPAVAGKPLVLYSNPAGPDIRAAERRVPEADDPTPLPSFQDGSRNTKQTRGSPAIAGSPLAMICRRFATSKTTSNAAPNATP